MYKYEELTEIIGSYCSLIVPYRGCCDGIVVGDYGIELVIHLSNGNEIVVSRDEVIIYD